MAYQFEEDIILDSSKVERAFGLRATPLEDALVATVRWSRDEFAIESRAA
jgi:hypothetical protein